MNEDWKLSFDPSLEVSDLGRVRTVARDVPCGPHPGKRALTAKILKQFVLSTGYAQVASSKRKKHLVHRLVAAAFVAGREEGLIVNHKNGNKLDNRPENLEWVTPSQNQKHAYRELGKVAWCKGVVSERHPTSKAVIAKNLATGDEMVFACALDAVRAGVATDSGSVSRCCHGKARWHNGHTFRFARHGVVFHEQEAA